MMNNGKGTGSMEISDYFFAVRHAGCSRVKYLAVFKTKAARTTFMHANRAWRGISSETDIATLLRARRPVVAGDLNGQEVEELYSLFNR